MLNKYLKQAIDAIQDGELRSYSGRGMYGSECVGLVVNHIAEFTIIVAQAAVFAEMNEEGEDFVLEVGDVEMDSMGKGMVFYWRSHTFKE